MLTERENAVKIEGILSEVDINEGSFERNGVKTETLGGTIKILVTQKINGKDTELEVPVRMFATKLTKNGSTNPAYESIQRVKDEMTSIAASNIDTADRVRITKGRLEMQEYYKNGNLVSFPAVSASFVTKIKKEDCKPVASFVCIGVIGSANDELDKEGMPTGRYKLKTMVPMYGGKVQVIPFIVSNPEAIDFIRTYWEVGNTAKMIGKLNFSTTTETTVVEHAFGEPTEETHTKSISEMIITGGDLLDGEFAIDAADVKQALTERDTYLAELKAKAEAKTTTTKKGGTTATPTKKKNDFTDFGF